MSTEKQYPLFDEKKKYKIGEIVAFKTEKGIVLRSKRKKGNKYYQWRILCKHAKPKDVCRECGGSAFCPHNIQKVTCRVCSPESFCEHDNLHRFCVKCGGNQTCKHGSHKRYCRKCKGSAFCKHDKLRARCLQCRGNQICKHDKQKRICKECCGKQISAFCKCGKFAQKQGCCTTCHPDYVETMIGVSKSGCKWIDRLEKELGIKIRHSHYDIANKKFKRDEFAAPCLPKSHVDGYHAETKTVFEFHGDHVHGHPNVTKTPIPGINKKAAFSKTEKKMKTLLENGYKIIYIWGSEFIKADRKKTAHLPLMSFCHVFDGTLYPQWTESSDLVAARTRKKKLTPKRSAEQEEIAEKARIAFEALPPSLFSRVLSRKGVEKEKKEDFQQKKEDFEDEEVDLEEEEEDLEGEEQNLEKKKEDLVDAEDDLEKEKAKSGKRKDREEEEEDEFYANRKKRQKKMKKELISFQAMEAYVRLFPNGHKK